MKKFFEVIFVFFVGLNFVAAQQKDSLVIDGISGNHVKNSEVKSLLKKGTMFVFWGWNRAGFSDSDIRFKGNGYDFTLQNVTAQDRPSPLSLDYINPGKVSIPQFNFRYAYFLKDNLALIQTWIY